MEKDAVGQPIAVGDFVAMSWSGGTLALGKIYGFTGYKTRDSRGNIVHKNTAARVRRENGATSTKYFDQIAKVERQNW